MRQHPIDGRCLPPLPPFPVWPALFLPKFCWHLGVNLSPHVALHFFTLGHYQSRLLFCLATYLSCDSHRLRVGSRYLPTYHLVRPTHNINASRAALFLVSSFWSSRVQTNPSPDFSSPFQLRQGALDCCSSVATTCCRCLVFFHPCWCCFIDFSSF